MKDEETFRFSPSNCASTLLERGNTYSLLITLRTIQDSKFKIQEGNPSAFILWIALDSD